MSIVQTVSLHHLSDREGGGVQCSEKRLLEQCLSEGISVLISVLHTSTVRSVPCIYFFQLSESPIISS